MSDPLFEALVEASSPILEDGSRVGIIGGGPGGAFTAYFLLDLAGRMGMDLGVDIFEPKDFTRSGPATCNHCGGIVSESLVQLLATEGINLPSSTVQRGIDAYDLHMDVGSVRIETPLQEQRIAAVHRGGGPKGLKEMKWGGFDGFLQNLAVEKGARLVPERVVELDWLGDRPQVKTKSGLIEVYDLVVGAIGVNTNSAKLFTGMDAAFEPPETTKTYICELPLGAEAVQHYIGSSMQVFLLNLPRLEFAALIPKGEYVTVCLLGEDIDKELIEAFLNSPQVRRCLPPDWQLPDGLACHCSPRINMVPASQPYGDRLVLVGDCGVTRLYKDGIGAAYRTAKAAATTAVFHGISAKDFAGHYGPVYRSITSDNNIGKGIFALTRQIQRLRFGRRAILSLVQAEQASPTPAKPLSGVLWDTFTGSAPYRDVLRRMFGPGMVLRLLAHLALALIPFYRRSNTWKRPHSDDPTPTVRSLSNREPRETACT